MRHQSWIAAMICLALVCAGPALAQDNIYLGNLMVMPSLSYQTEYSDNIFLSHTDETEDLIHTVTPGIGMEYRTGEERYIRAGYEVDFVRFSDTSDNDYEEHRADLETSYSIPSGWYAGLENAFVDIGYPEVW